ncbi:MAG: lactate utilization protein [Treponema sp.]|jgi:hypothetical protein|nr:lactate utilization protein [Treponema sp.]
MQEKDNAIAKQFERSAATLIKNLQSRNFESYYCRTKEDAAAKALSLIPEDASVTWGGSMSVVESGLIEEIKKSKRAWLDRDEAKSADERLERTRKAFFCDFYLSSVNAISEDGIFINIDGFGNRVAAISFGPKNVILIAGMNKLCKTLAGARERARNFAAPANAQRVFKTFEGGQPRTPCATSGFCGDCKSADCICSYIVETRMCKIPGRIKIILVGESLGF